MSQARMNIALHMIDRLLILKKMSRKELAEKLGVTQAAISLWLTGVDPIPERRMIDIAEALGVDSRIIFPDRRFSNEEAGSPTGS